MIATLICAITTIVCVTLAGIFFYMVKNKGFNRWKEHMYHVKVFDDKRCVVHYKSPKCVVGPTNVKMDVMDDPVTDVVKVRITCDFERYRLWSVLVRGD